MSLDRVPGPAELYIGGIISMRRYEALKKANITHVVSALRQPLDPALFANYQHLVVELDDVDDEDILQHFATSNAFIQAGLAAGGGVLVHCAMGKSRSATLVLAYLLSQDATLTPTAALERLRTARALAEPNDGFWQQLELYHSMGCPLDVPAEPKYQRWLYQREVDLSVACGRAPDRIRFEDEEAGRTSATSDSPTASSATSDPSASPSIEFRCRRCRQRLGSSEFLVPHTSKPPSATQTAQTAHLEAGTTSGPLAATPCAHLFVDPLSWMRPELEQEQLEGKLRCPNPRCAAVVGKYAWQGMRCSCGRWVLPALSLARNRVDEVRPAAGRGSLGKI